MKGLGVAISQKLQDTNKLQPKKLRMMAAQPVTYR